MKLVFSGNGTLMTRGEPCRFRLYMYFMFSPMKRVCFDTPDAYAAISAEEVYTSVNPYKKRGMHESKGL